MSTRPLALTDLTDPREAAFVAAVVERGPSGAAEAALHAGYATTLAEAERAAAFLMGADRIRRAIVGETQRRFDTLVLDAQNALAEIVRDKRAPASARISAAQEIMNRSSIGPVPSRSVSARVTLDESSIESMIERLDTEEAARAKTIEGKRPT